MCTYYRISYFKCKVRHKSSLSTLAKDPIIPYIMLRQHEDNRKFLVINRFVGIYLDNRLSIEFSVLPIKHLIMNSFKILWILKISPEIISIIDLKLFGYTVK